MSDKAQPQSQGQESLRRLLEIEDDAQDLMRAADERAEERISKAKQKAGSILGGARTGAQKEAETLIQEAKAEAEEEAEQLLENANSEVEALGERAERNMEEAASLLVAWVTAES